jgi:ABC-type iron transport system FetAB ATPase subunit
MSVDFPQAATPRLSLRQLRSSHAGPISLNLAAGECLALVGASGAGKSVCLRMIADLDPSDGEVLLDGVSRSAWRAPDWRSMVVYQPAEPAWWDPTPESHFPPSLRARAQALLPQLKLKPEVWKGDLSRLSTGERQRLALVRSLAVAPKVLLLDEPAAALDHETTLALEAVLRTHLDDGMAIILVTHSAEQATRMAQRQVRMVNGQLELPCTPSA